MRRPKAVTNRREWGKAAITAALAGLSGTGCSTEEPPQEEPVQRTGKVAPPECPRASGPLLRVKVVTCPDGTKGFELHPPEGLKLAKRVPPHPKVALMMMDPSGETDPLTVKQVADSNGETVDLDDVFQPGHPGSSFELKVGPPLSFVVKANVGISPRCTFENEAPGFARAIHFDYGGLEHCHASPDHTDIQIEC